MMIVKIQMTIVMIVGENHDNDDDGDHSDSDEDDVDDTNDQFQVHDDCSYW